MLRGSICCQWHLVMEIPLISHVQTENVGFLCQCQCSQKLFVMQAASKRISRMCSFRAFKLLHLNLVLILITLVESHQIKLSPWHAAVCGAAQKTRAGRVRLHGQDPVKDATKLVKFITKQCIYTIFHLCMTVENGAGRSQGDSKHAGAAVGRRQCVETDYTGLKI